MVRGLLMCVTFISQIPLCLCLCLFVCVLVCVCGRSVYRRPVYIVYLCMLMCSLRICVGRQSVVCLFIFREFLWGFFSFNLFLYYFSSLFLFLLCISTEPFYWYQFKHPYCLELGSFAYIWEIIINYFRSCIFIN